LFVDLDVVELVIIEKWHEESLRECYCGMKAYLRTSWTDKNPGRQFFGCTQYGKGQHCKYFEWFEPRLCERGGKLVFEMRVRIKAMEDERRKQAKKEKRSNVLLFMSWGLIVALLLGFMC
jgi:hypothetical protein